MPSGSKVYTNRETKNMLAPTPSPTTSNGANTMQVNIPKLADSIIIREDSDIDRIAREIVSRIMEARFNFGGA